MHSSGTNSRTKGRLNISDVGSGFGLTKLAAGALHIRAFCECVGACAIRGALTLAVLSALLLIAARPAQAQTETVLYNFTGNPDGTNPNSNLTPDGNGNFYVNVASKSLEQELLWDDVAKSGDLDKYYKFVKLHPSDHVHEMRKLVDAFWQAKIMEGERAGKRVVYNANEVGRGQGTRGIVTIGSGPVPVYNVDLYSDPTNPLKIGLHADNSFFYLGGRGLGVANDTIYCFGYVKGTKVTDLKELQTLDLSGTEVTVESDFHGGAPLTLQTLDLSGTAVTDADLERLKDIKGLTALALWNTAVTDAGLKFLEGLKGLLWLDLSGTAVSDAGLEHLRYLQELRTLHLEKTKATDAGVANLRKALPGCAVEQTW